MLLLIVDDSKNIRTAIKKSLELVSAVGEIIEAEDVDDGLKLIRENCPDILILDLMLKTGTGIDLLKEIKDLKKRPYTILYSNFLDEEYKRKAREFKVDDFFDKSEDILKLVDKIINYTQKAK